MSESIIKKAKEKLNNRPILAIDYLLELFSKAKKEDTQNLLNLFCQAILKNKGIDEDSWLSDPVEELFNEKIDFSIKKFIGICLLRMLSTNYKYFEDQEYRNKAYRLFDDVFSNDLYPILKIRIKDQTYVKESKLKEVVPKLESEIIDIITSLENLNMLSIFRNKFMKKIKSDLTKLIIYPFLPKGLIDLRLDEIFKSVEEYIHEKDPKSLYLFKEAKYNLENYLMEAERHGTRYSINYLGGFANKLIKLLEAHLESSPLGKPAQLTIKESVKKYPFNIKDKSFDLSFIVQNATKGYALNVYLKVINRNLKIEKPEIYLGNIDSDSTVVTEIPVKVIYPKKSVKVSVELRWINYDNSSNKEKFKFELMGQPTNVDWNSLEQEEPYSLEPVETEEELVGRKEVLEQLVSRAKAKSTVSSYMYGQKRVGKTSVVKTLKSKLDRLNLSDYLVVYLERGDYISSNPKETIKNLGERICKKIKRADARFSNLNTPTFTDSLSPLTEFLDSLHEIVPSYYILFILDEFDELPIELYKRGSIGDAFFATLRSISGKRPFSFILVGSENMKHIMDFQGYALNKFQSIQLSYFNKEEYWSDFQELVRRPVKQWMEIEEDALETIYRSTAGNPFFTKLICSRLYRTMVKNRDCHVTQSEAEEAIKYTIQQDLEVNKVQHFWIDGIFETGINLENKSMNRRRLLLCLAESFRQHGKAEKNDIVKRGEKDYGSDSITIVNELREFVRRDILIKENNTYDFKMPLFRGWLKESGLNNIITTFSEPDEYIKYKKQEEKAHVQPKEISKVIEKWGTYKGKSISEGKVQTWLEQFENNINKRLIFCILQNIKFYSNDNIRTKMKEAHGIIERGLIHQIVKGKHKRSDILVSYLDCPGKSGSHYAKLYVDENSIYYRNIIERNKLCEVIKSKHSFKALVFIDDFIGTGDSASGYFRGLFKDCEATLKNTSLKIFFIVVSGFQKAQSKVINECKRKGLNVEVHICDPLDESARAFSDKSKIFPKEQERLDAKNICQKYGSTLVKKYPLGYGDCQATVVFEDSCPNNTLPILWAKSKDWMPLFPRL